MKPPAEKQNAQLMRRMFSAIAPRYDFVTRIFSFGMDGRWKRDAVSKAALREDCAILDLACGTADFSLLVRQRFPQAKCVGVDLTERMLRLARERGLGEVACADATRLPFADASFDCVFIGYGLRNFPNLDAAIREVARVTRPGGEVSTLDFFLPQNPAFRKLYLAYLYAQGAFWGLLLHGTPRAYTYIPDSLRNFVSAEELSLAFERRGYERVRTRLFILGGIGVHWATRSRSAQHEHGPNRESRADAAPLPLAGVRE